MTVFINSNTSLGYSHSKNGVQFSHLHPPNSTHLFLPPVGAFFDRIGLPPAVMGWAASCDGGP